jgi:hypothetical protein
MGSSREKGFLNFRMEESTQVNFILVCPIILVSSSSPMEDFIGEGLNREGGMDRGFGSIPTEGAMKVISIRISKKALANWYFQTERCMKVLLKTMKSMDTGQHTFPVAKNMKDFLNQEKPMVRAS